MAPSQKRTADFTCLWTAEGWLDVAAVIGLFPRRVVGCSMRATMTAQRVADALMGAIWRRGKPRPAAFGGGDALSARALGDTLGRGGAGGVAGVKRLVHKLAPATPGQRWAVERGVAGSSVWISGFQVERNGILFRPLLDLIARGGVCGAG